MALVAGTAAAGGAVAAVMWRSVEGESLVPQASPKNFWETGSVLCCLGAALVVAACSPNAVSTDKLHLLVGCIAGSFVGVILGMMLLTGRDQARGTSKATKAFLRTRWGFQSSCDNSGAGRAIGFKDNFLLAKNSDESSRIELEFVQKEAGSSSYLVKTGEGKYLSKHFDLKVTSVSSDAPEKRMECKFYRQVESKTPECDLELGTPYYINAENAEKPTSWWSHKDDHVTLRSSHYAQPFHLEKA